MLSFLEGLSHNELGRDLGSRLVGEGLLCFLLPPKSLSLPAISSGKKRKGFEGSLNDWGPSEVGLQKQMPSDLLRKISEVAFIGAEVCHKGLGHCCCRC